MKPEYKTKAQQLLESITMRLEVLDGMMKGTRPTDVNSAKDLMKHIKYGVSKVGEIVDIS